MLKGQLEAGWGHAFLCEQVLANALNYLLLCVFVVLSQLHAGIKLFMSFGKLLIREKLSVLLTVSRHVLFP